MHIQGNDFKLYTVNILGSSKHRVFKVACLKLDPFFSKVVGRVNRPK